MINRLLKYITTALVKSLGLLAIGLIIWYFMKDSQTALQDILFWVGAVPIGLFSVGVFGDFFGRGNAAFQLSQSVSSQSSNQRAVQDANDKKSKVKNGINWILSGGFIWVTSYVLWF